MQAIVDVERIFNFTGSIPIVGIASGGVRGTLGGLQTTVGSIITGVGLVGEGINPGSKHWIDVRKSGLEHTLHGTLNATRGAAEAAFASLALGGNVLALASLNANVHPGVAFGMALISLLPMSIQMISKNGFAPRIQYDSQIAQAQKANRHNAQPVPAN